jgi:hypothetical protein
MFALFEKETGKQLCKAHSTVAAVKVEAFEAKHAFHASPDFPGDIGGLFLNNNVEIREIPNE